MSTPVAVYQFRTTSENIPEDLIINWLKDNCKKWSFQEEKSDTGYIHYQGGFSLIKKRRKQEIINKLFPYDDLKAFEYIEPAFDVESLYNLKKDTRIRGPWTSEDIEEQYIPKQYRNKLNNLYPFQKKIWDSQFEFDDRHINYIYCPNGGKGKTTISSLMELHNAGIKLPAINDYKEVMQLICNYCSDRKIRELKSVHIDLPRALDKSRLFGLISAIESIKDGKLFDTRYHYKVYWIDSPQIWIYSNNKPDLSMLSADRWKIWTISDDKDLIIYNQLDI